MAKPHLRAEARELRLAGCTYDEIVERLGVSKSSVSLWVRDVPFTDNPVRKRRVAAHVRAMAEARWSDYRAERDERRAKARADAADTVTSLSHEELLRLGALIYWCEGAKTKAWREHDADVRFINSDPTLIDLFLCFLRAAGITEERIQYRVSIHESAEVDGAVRWWANWVGVSPTSFGRTSLKRHNPEDGSEERRRGLPGLLGDKGQARSGAVLDDRRPGRWGAPGGGRGSRPGWVEQTSDGMMGRRDGAWCNWQHRRFWSV